RKLFPRSGSSAHLAHGHQGGRRIIMESDTAAVPPPDGAPPVSTPVAAAAVPAQALAVDTPVAKPLPKRDVITRRVFLLGGFWSGLMLAIVGLSGPALDFMWPR